jgi:phage repressor protein C with HTH and peptisase S24 domain
MAGAFTEETAVMEFECERYVIPAFKGADFLIQVKGDSMQPTYYSGDLVACQCNRTQPYMELITN